MSSTVHTAAAEMDFKSDNYNVDRAMYGPVNPFLGYQGNTKFGTPYQFPALQDPSIYSIGGGTFDHDANHGFGLKYGSGGSVGGGGGGTGYGHSGAGAAAGVQSHYGPPMMQSKGGKLKGAALSALTLLAFLFFLNLLQSCLKV
jgi:hypothetical protein